jgi:hypothetical protein
MMNHDGRLDEEIIRRLIPREQWNVYAGVIEKASARGLKIALGGGLAVSVYSGYLRNTKDMDLYVLPEERESLLAIMMEEGFEEYTAVPYDRKWSYRGHRNGYILDLLWMMLNERAPLDDVWVTGGRELKIDGVSLRMIPPEELIWTKLYIMQRERCDWPDAFNIAFAMAQQLNWERLVARMGIDAPVLGSFLTLLRWMCPGAMANIPQSVWERTGLLPSEQTSGPKVHRDRVALFNGDTWFPETLQWLSAQ